MEAIILNVTPPLTKIEYSSLLVLASGKKEARIKRFRHERDAHNCLLGDMLSQIMICRATGLGNDRLEFSATEFGKPFLVNDLSIHFNISHSGDYVVCVVDNEPVGIDVEMIKPINRKIAERFFAQDEVAYILSARDDFDIQRFYEVWTRKESRIKWEGKGLSTPLPSFSVFDPTEPGRPVYHKVFHNDTAICHVCSAKSEAPAVRTINTSDFLELCANMQP